ncbi:MAG: hypothetical protein ABSG01_09415 [Anaerolineales bacterium]|jgi:hypothetical protein
MTKSKLDKRRVTLEADVISLKSKMETLTGQLEIAKSELAQVIDQAITDGNMDVKVYRSASGSVEMLSTILTELNKRHLAAKLAVWTYDLEKSREALREAGAQVNKARQEVLQVQSDKVAYLRTIGGSKADPNKISSFDILLADGRARAKTAEQERDKCKMELRQMQEDYNLAAGEFGVEQVEVMDTMQLLSGH